ncbi:MAG: hypothetical protein AB1Z67_09985 [Candidatus Limnocylindrales bacterium]
MPEQSHEDAGAPNPGLEEGNTRLEERTRDELHDRARELDIEGRSSDGKVRPRRGHPRAILS